MSLHRIARRYLLAKVLPKFKMRAALNTNVELPLIWYETEDGRKWIPTSENPYDPVPPKEFKYQHSRFPRQLTESVLRLISREDIEACDHAETLIDHGLIEDFDGRICRSCGGSQTKPKGAPWPTEWAGGGGSKSFYSGTSTYPTDLVLARVRPTPEETASATQRGHTIRPVSFDRAVIIAASACERCLNVLLYRHGLRDGYEEGSEAWQKSNTRCLFCE